LYIDLKVGEKASFDELRKIAELFGFDDERTGKEEEDDVRLVNVEEGMGELFDLIPDDADTLVDNLDLKIKMANRRASILTKQAMKGGGSLIEETPEEREQIMLDLMHKDFAEEESDDDDLSVESWDEELRALKFASQEQSADDDDFINEHSQT
jgi:hypothetical protein